MGLLRSTGMGLVLTVVLLTTGLPSAVGRPASVAADAPRVDTSASTPVEVPRTAGGGSTGPIGGRLFSTLTTLPDGVTNSVAGLVIDPTQGEAFAANRFAGTVTEFNETTGALEAVVPVAEFAAGTFPSGLAIDLTGHRLFVPIDTTVTAGSTGGWLLVLNESTLQLIANVSFPGAPLGVFEPTFLSFDAPSDQVFVENATAGEIAAVNLSRGSVQGYLPCPVAQCAMHGYGLLDIPSEHTLLLPTCQPVLWLVNTSNDSTRAVVTGPPDTIMAWSAYDTVNQILWVENYTYYGSAGSFLAYNLTNLSLLRNVAGAPPRGSAIAYDPVDNLLLATDLNGSEKISAYDASNATLVAAYSSTGGGLHPFTAVADDPVTHLVLAAGSGNGSTLAFHLPTLDLARTYPSFPFQQTASAIGGGVAGVAYIAGTDPTSLRAITEENGTRLWETPLPPGAYPAALATDPATQTVYVADEAQGTVWAYGASSGGFLASIDLGNTTGPCGMVLDGASQTLYVGETFPPAVAAVDLATERVTGIVDLPGASPCRLAIDPASGDLLILSTGASGGLWELGLPGLTVTSPWAVGPTPADLAVGSDGTAFVLDLGGTQLSVVNGTTGSPITNVSLSGSPASGLALDPTDGLVFVTSGTGGTVEVRNASGGGLAGTLLTSGTAADPTFDPASGTLVAPLVYAGEVFVASTVPVPSAPLGLRVTAGNTSANASWSPPASSGPYPVDGYLVGVRATNTTGPGTLVATGALQAAVSGLQDGTVYTLSVTAKSVAGAGTVAAVASVTPVGVPFPPQNVTATSAGDGAIAVNWSPPASDDGSSVVGYVVWIQRASGGVPQVTEEAPGTNATTISGLAASTTYSVYVTALNAVGTSHPSQVVQATTAAAPPASLPLTTYLILGLVVVGVAAFAVYWRPRRPRPARHADARTEPSDQDR